MYQHIIQNQFNIFHNGLAVVVLVGHSLITGLTESNFSFLPSWRRPLSCFWRRQSVLSLPWLGHRRKTGLVQGPHCTCSVSQVHRYAAQINKGINIHNKVKCLKRLHISQTLIHKTNHKYIRCWITLDESECQITTLKL